MRVRLFLEYTVEDFAASHANAKKHFDKWLDVIRYADWNEPADITKTLNSNLLGNGSNRIVFDIGGNGKNAFRIICDTQWNCYYEKSKSYKVHLYVNWIGTHEEYNALTEEQKRTICIY